MFHAVELKAINHKFEVKLEAIRQLVGITVGLLWSQWAQTMPESQGTAFVYATPN